MNIKAASCSDADVQSAINLVRAAGGGVAEMPAGIAEWTTGVDLWPTVSLIGSGDTTHIVDSTPKDGSDRSIAIRAALWDGFEMAGFRLDGNTPDPATGTQKFNKGHIKLSGTASRFRIHHLDIRNNQCYAIKTYGQPFGLIDHVKLQQTQINQSLIEIGCGGAFGDASGLGDKSWATPIQWGSLEALYIEDCEFVNTVREMVSVVLDPFTGARAVIRKNKFLNCCVSSHGTESGGRARGMRYYEAYDNEFDFYVGPDGLPIAGVDAIFWIRGGTASIFRNTVKNAVRRMAFNSFVKTNLKRDGESFAPWGKCDGTGPYDKNDAGQNGYMCIDQVGAGTSKDLGGVTNPPPGWVQNESDPIYEWENQLSDTTSFGFNGGAISESAHVKHGRDFFLNTPRPGYVPAAYPHPLQRTEPIPPPVNVPPTVTIKAPTNGQVITVKNFLISIAGTDGDAEGVAWLELYINDVLVKSAATQTLTYTWNTAPYKGKGPVAIKAVVKDADGASVSETVVVSVKK